MSAFDFIHFYNIGFHCTEFEVFDYVTTVAMKILIWVKNWEFTYDLTFTNTKT